MQIKGKMSLSSRLWLDREINDPYVQQARDEGYRCRAVYKLQEIEAKFRLIKKSRAIIDLGAAPGGWSQFLSEKSVPNTKIAAIDLLDFPPIDGVQQFIGDFEDINNQQAIMDYLGGKADLIVSDMAPNTVGQSQTDHIRIMRLVSSAYDFAKRTLAKDGAFVAKVFMGGSESSFVNNMKADFRNARFFKPKASRTMSAEIYIIGLGFRR